MTATTGFVSFLILTVVLLLGTIATGLRAQRRRHLPLVACTVASLGITIYFAEKLGQEYNLEAAGAIYPIHITMAKVTTFAYLLPLITGFMTLKSGKVRPRHRLAAFSVVIMTVLTLGTGLAMILLAERLDAAPAEVESAQTPPALQQSSPDSQEPASAD